MLIRTSLRAQTRNQPITRTRRPPADGYNDNAANVEYPTLDGRIRDTYAKQSSATLKNSLYDSYIRAIRWASDRIGDAGIIAYVSNAGWIDGNTADGLRKCLADEFSNIHVFHLRGNQRTSGERSRREGGKIFGGSSRTPVAITLLVKNPQATDQSRIHFHDIGDYLTRERKLEIIKGFGSIGGIGRVDGWRVITPDDYGDWLAQRDQSFESHIALGDKKGGKSVLFERYSGGVSSGRDAWVYNASRKALASKMEQMISFYNAEGSRFDAAHPNADRKERESSVDRFINSDSSKISWTRALKADLVKGKRYAFDETCLVPSLYRPFMRNWLYYSRAFNEMVLQMPRIFPLGGEEVENRIISVPAPGNVTPFSTFMSNTIFDLSVTAAKAGTQCFPRYLYDEKVVDDDFQHDMLPNSGSGNGRPRRDAITDEGLAHFQVAYPGHTITKDDIFYYVYGLLHSEDYRSRYADNLSKELPRIPAVTKVADFLTFVEAGRKLGDLHCGYEAIEPYPVTFIRGETDLIAPSDPVSFYRVEKIKFAGKRPKLDKTTIIYNANITIADIPLVAYEYVVNGKSGIDWVMERQCVSVDKASGIVNDANAYANETMGDPAYPLKLLLSVITVSMRTLEIVRALPPLDIMLPPEASTT